MGRRIDWTGLRPGECGTCGWPYVARDGSHAWWCWTADPTQPNLGDSPQPNLGDPPEQSWRWYHRVDRDSALRSAS